MIGFLQQYMMPMGMPGTASSALGLARYLSREISRQPSRVRGQLGGTWKVNQIEPMPWPLGAR